MKKAILAAIAGAAIILSMGFTGVKNQDTSLTKDIINYNNKIELTINNTQ